MKTKAYNIHFSILQFILPTMGTIICYALLIREVTVMVKNEEGKPMSHNIFVIFYDVYFMSHRILEFCVISRFYTSYKIALIIK